MAKSVSMNNKKEGHHHISAMEPSSSSIKDIKDKRYSLNDEHGASFRNIGFCRWGKDWLPIIQLGPMDVEPGSVRDMWYDMYHAVSFCILCISCVYVYLQYQLHMYIPLHYVFMFIVISYFYIIFIILYCRARRVAVQ